MVAEGLVSLDWWGREEWNLLFAVVVIVVGWYAGKVLVRVLGRRVARRFQRPSVSRTILRALRVGSLLVGVFAAMGFLGLGLGDLVLSVTVFSAVLGLVLAPIVGSVINGVFVLADQPYEIGDLVEITDTGERGFVEDITLRYTKVFTLDNTFLVVPNGTMRERDIINYSAEDERTRLSLKIGVTYEGDLDEARRLIETAAGEVDDVISGGPGVRIGSARYPAKPTCYIDEYGDSSVNLTLRYWAREPYKLLSVRSKVQEKVWEKLSETDSVNIAYPHRHLVFDDTSERPDPTVSDRER
ncbi:mechanosensitive ion channel family protein [Salarchaeum japonicum]|uniref:mechanosensitive ion channel family protein n=1 Tax=Salarchaeum japonicum TaxID=555573 RepID=UPI003C763F68